jgi:hypothetical protein
MFGQVNLGGIQASIRATSTGVGSENTAIEHLVLFWIRALPLGSVPPGKCSRAILVPKEQREGGS